MNKYLINIILYKSFLVGYKIGESHFRKIALMYYWNCDLRQ